MKQAQSAVLSFRALGSTLLIASLYFLLTVFLTNSRFLTSTIMSHTAIIYKLRILSDLSIGIFTAFGAWQGVLLILTSLLIGLNLTLLLRNIASLHRQGRMRLSVGGIAAVSLVTTGCSSCGVSLLSFALPSAAVVLPFNGLILQIVGVVLLSVSFVYTFRKLSRPAVCQRH